MAKGREYNPELSAIMTDVIIPGPAPDMPPALTYSGVHRSYAESIYGWHHAQEDLRYSQNYGYERDQMLADLGEDIHPVGHMWYTQKEVAVPFLAAQIWDAHKGVDTAEIQAIRLAATTHDMGKSKHESIAANVGPPVGDIPYKDKKKIHAEQERKIRQFIYAELYPDVPAELFNAAESVIDTDETLSGVAFDTIERVGYYETAMRAARHAIELARQSEIESKRFTSLARLALDVTGRHHDILGVRGKTFPYARGLLLKNKRTYIRAYTELPGLLDQVG